MTDDQQPKRRETGIARRVGALLATTVFGLAAATVAGYVTGWWWPFALVEHLRVQLLWALILLGGGLVLLRWRWAAAVAVGALALNLITLLPYWLGGGSSAETTLTLLHLNTDRGRVSTLDYLEEQDEDLVLLQEVTPAFAELLEDLEHYRLVEASPRDNTHGSAVLVRRDWSGEVVSSEVIHIPATNERPLLRTDVLVDDRPVSVLSYHAIRPGGGDRTRYHRTELGHLASWVEALDGEIIIIGDFNATPWSQPVRTLESAGLHSSNRGHGLEGTWSATRPGLLQIPIDLCLHSSGWETVAHSIGPPIGGDHRPLHVALGHSDGLAER